MKKLNNLIAVIFLILFTSCVIITSCKKDAESNMTKKEMLTSKPWKKLSSKTNGKADVIKDCELDDLITYAADGTYTADRGAIKCSSGETNFTSTWSLSADEKSLTVNGTTVNIIELTESKFVYSVINGPVPWEGTFVH